MKKDTVDDRLHVEATFWRLGDEVWIECDHGIVMLPPDSPMRAQIPDKALHDDSELDRFVAELRAGSAGPRLAVTVDDVAKTAVASNVPFDYEGHRLVASVWEGHPVHWHVRKNRMRALWKGKAVAEVKTVNGNTAFAGSMGLVDGALWWINGEFCMLTDDIRHTFKKAQWAKVEKEGTRVDVVRSVLARPLGTAYKPEPGDDEATWIGPARIQRLYYTLVHTRFDGAAWHATSTTDPVLVTQSGKRVAIVMPAPLTTKGGQA